MARDGTVAVLGYRELLRACDRAGKEAKVATRAAFRQAGEIVRADTARRLQRFSAVSAAKVRVRVRVNGVSVEQSARKTTGKRADYGGLQMRDAFIPALEENEGRVEAEIEHAIDQVVKHFSD